MTTLLELIAAGSLDGTVWAFAQEPEFKACPSRLYGLNGDPERSARCVVLHAETGETLHSARIDGHSIFWSDEQAAAALAAYMSLPTCANCRSRYSSTAWGSYCDSRCQWADKHAADEYEQVEL